MGKHQPNLPRNNPERVRELCSKHIGLAHSMVQHYFGMKPTEERYDEMLAEAYFKMVEVARLYNPDHPSLAKFSTLYCGSVIKHFIRVQRVERRFGMTRVGDSKKGNCLWSQKVFQNSLNTLQGETGEEFAISLTYKEHDPNCRDDDLIWLEQQMRLLTEEQREWLHDRYQKGLTLLEIGERRNCSRQNVQQTIEYILNILRKRHTNLVGEAA